MPTSSKKRVAISSLITSFEVAEAYLQINDKALCVNGDNFTWLPNSSIDLILTDPPFNIAQDTNFHTWKNNTINSYRFDKDKGWDSYEHSDFVELLNAWAKEFYRVLRPGGSFGIFCADAYISHLLDALEIAGLSCRRVITWRKPNAVPINRKTMMMSSCEYIVMGVKGSKATFNSDIPLLNVDQNDFRCIEEVLVADKVATIVEKAVREALAKVSETGALRSEDVEKAVQAGLLKGGQIASKKVSEMYINDSYLRGCVPNYVQFNSKAGSRLHPTEKPVTLLKYLIALFSKPEDLVLDPFGGSGSTGQACLELGRRIVTIEQDTEYFAKLSTRVKEVEKSIDGKLF